MCLLLGIYSPDNKGEVLEVGDKLLIYIQHAVGNLSPWERQLCSQPEVSEAQGLRVATAACTAAAAAAAAAWTPPVGLKWKVHRPYHYGLPLEYANTSVSGLELQWILH